MTSEWTTCVRRRPRTCSRRPLLVDWRPEDPGASGNPGHSSKVQAAVSISGGTPTNEYITRDDGPAIFFHGTEDPVVFFDWAAGNAATMYNLGIVTCLEPFERAAHGRASSSTSCSTSAARDVGPIRSETPEFRKRGDGVRPTP
jgi:hypothetical protein